jgi:hypothetical protein
MLNNRIFACFLISVAFLFCACRNVNGPSIGDFNANYKSGCVDLRKIDKTSSEFSILYTSSPRVKLGDGFTPPALVLDGRLSIEDSAVYYIPYSSLNRFVLFDYKQQTNDIRQQELEFFQYEDDKSRMKKLTYYSTLKAKHYSPELEHSIFTFEFSAVDFYCRPIVFVVSNPFDILSVAKTKSVSVGKKPVLITTAFCGDSIFYRNVYGEIEYEEGVCE